MHSAICSLDFLITFFYLFLKFIILIICIFHLLNSPCGLYMETAKGEDTCFVDRLKYETDNHCAMMIPMSILINALFLILCTLQMNIVNFKQYMLLVLGLTKKELKK